jgi:hypothetical protein
MSAKFPFVFFVLALAHASAFIHPFMWEELPLPLHSTPNSSRRFHLAPLRLYSNQSGVPWPNYRSLPVHSRIAQAEIKTQRIENMVGDLFSVLLNAEDLALIERQARDSEIYIDKGFNMSRKPFMLRNGIREIVGKYSIAVRPLERKWTTVDGYIHPYEEKR